MKKYPKLLVVDIDGTLVEGQSQQLLLRYLRQKKQISLISYTALIVWFVLYKLHLIKKTRKAMELGATFARGKTEKDVELLLKDFFESHLSKKINQQVEDYIENARKQGVSLLILSNVFLPLAKVVASNFGIKDVIATKLCLTNGRFTGVIDGPVMYGHEKVGALQYFCEVKNIALSDCASIADHISDIPMLEIVGKPVAKKFSRLESVALIRGWEIV